MASSSVPAPAGSTNGTTRSMPVKTREVYQHHMDSTAWNDFNIILIKFRPDDIIISTYPKAGTTWTQQIVSQLPHAGDETVAPNTLSPWVELRIIPRDALIQMLEAQTSRRFLKTHLPIDTLVWNPQAKYIFCGRDGRDSMWSLHNHLSAATDTFYQLINDIPGRVGPPLARPGDNPRTSRKQPNVLLIHYSDLKAGLDGEMRRIANTFDWMKAHAHLSAPQQADVAWKEGAKSFIHKGTNGRWKDILSEDDNRRYLERAKRELGDECALWLEKGRLQAS
ncbi:P-loop containing nucleoside triphosphate hydrolase protein [Xylaria sp. FL0043]|nr:P-loop containing nucleoside triphosphate hydrolase protein [Xylaria sp. FL0043]